MKKFILSLLIFILLLTTACSTDTKYPYKHVGVYDTKTNQYIDIGNSKDKIDKILGSSTKNKGGWYEYDDILSICFDDDNNVERISIYFAFFPDDGRNERYTLADGTNYNSTITEFINKYKHVYENALIHMPDSAVSVILQNKNGKLILPSSDDIKKMHDIIISSQGKQNNDDMYAISIDYFAYDDLSSFRIEKISPPEFKWNNFKEIETCN